MTDSIFWIWMQEALGRGSIKAERVIRSLGSPEALYGMTRDELAGTGLFTSREIDRIKAAPLDGARENLRLAKKYRCEVITPDHPDYPAILTQIDGLPCVLYVVGSLNGLRDELVITMVGTRSSTPEGEQAANKLAFDLATAGCTVASGLAVGIDCASHEGALRAKGRSAGLLACGMDVDYPMASNQLKRRIVDQGGVLITEFPFGEPAHRGNFVIRNRILSGIAPGTVVVQAPESSGALITARHAEEQNRDVFAVPGGIFDKSMAGCNRLIRDGAKMVVNVYSILEEYINRFPESIDPKTVVSRIERASATFQAEPLPDLPRKAAKRNGEGKPKESPKAARQVSRALGAEELASLELSGEAVLVCGLLGREPVDFEALSGQSGLETSALMGALTELELCGLAAALPGRRYLLGGHKT